MISQFFLISPRGDCIINRDFRGDIAKGTSEIFFRKAKAWAEEACPIFNLNGVNYIFIRRSGLYFVLTTLHNVGPSYLLELLLRITGVIKDFCGVLNEECVRKNFALVYEIIDEVLDFGYPQLTNTEHLKQTILSEVIAVEQSQNRQLPLVSFGASSHKSVTSSASHRPIGSVVNDVSSREKKNEIFVDVLEEVATVINGDGSISCASIEGSIRLKSYLHRNPELTIALNELIIVSSIQGALSDGDRSLYKGCTILDDCNFHPNVNLSEFDEFRILSLTPPDGEFVLMNYRVTSRVQLPFTISVQMEEPAANKLDFFVKLYLDLNMRHSASNVTAVCPLPKKTSFAACDVLPGSSIHMRVAVKFSLMLLKSSSQSAEYRASENKAVWVMKKVDAANGPPTLRCRLYLNQPVTESLKKEIGPLNLQFEIPMYSISGLQDTFDPNVRYLRVLDQKDVYLPQRWVRYITQSSSYVYRF